MPTLRLYDYKREKGKPRPGWTYRGARRNASRGQVWKGVKPYSIGRRLRFDPFKFAGF